MNNQIVSVLMSVYNEPVSFVSRSIQSVLDQTYPHLQVIIIIDNPQNTDAIQYIEKIAASDARVEYHINEQNKGLVFSLNRALTYAKGEYIARMDADDISLPERFQEEMQFLKKGKYDIVGCNITDIDVNEKKADTITKYPETHENHKQYLRFGSSMAHPTWFGKKKVFETLKGYRDIDACEDYDFLVRAVEKGFRLGACQKVMLLYRINPNGISSTKKAKQKTALYIIRKYYRAGKPLSLETFNQFISSEQGDKKRMELEKYYQMSSKLKNYRGNKLKFCGYGCWMMLTCPNAREVFREQMFIKKMK